MRYDKTSNSQDSAVHALMSIIFGTFFGTVFCALMLVAFSLMFLKVQNIPIDIIPYIVIAIAGLGAFVGAYFTARMSGEKGMLYGILSGALLFVVLFISGMVAVREPVTTITLVKSTLMLLTGAIGGIIGVNKRRR